MRPALAGPWHLAQRKALRLKLGHVQRVLIHVLQVEINFYRKRFPDIDFGFRNDQLGKSRAVLRGIGARVSLPLQNFKLQRLAGEDLPANPRLHGGYGDLSGLSGDQIVIVG